MFMINLTALALTLTDFVRIICACHVKPMARGERERQPTIILKIRSPRA